MRGQIMKIISFFFLMCLVIFTGGCVHETYYVDHEYGKSTIDAFDRQIAHQDYKYANKSVEGLDGIHAEPTMEMYHDSFGEGFTDESISILDPGAN